MFKVSIFKNNVKTNGADFETEAQAQAWIAYGIAQGYWSDDITSSVEDITAQIEAQKKLEVRKDKRLFGEGMVDHISLINEQAAVNEAALETLLLDQDFTVIREHLYSGSLKSAYNKILAIEPKILTVFSQADLDLIKAKLLAKLQELGEM